MCPRVRRGLSEWVSLMDLWLRCPSLSLYRGTITMSLSAHEYKWVLVIACEQALWWRIGKGKGAKRRGRGRQHTGKHLACSLTILVCSMTHLGACSQAILVRENWQCAGIQRPAFQPGMGWGSITPSCFALNCRNLLQIAGTDQSTGWTDSKAWNRLN